MAKSLEAFKVKKEFSEHIDRIMNTYSFRKLSGKTQVILSLTGPAVRTRLTHTVEVARIAREISEELGLNVELTEAIALAHDIGHTPFGHVGERTLREIMCGCDNLKGRVHDFDFYNSGFKHNLQSFRALTTLEGIADDHDPVWAYILWGVPAHSKMSYSKPYSGMENEIYISCKHCDWVFSCFFHDKKECKRNILDKKKRETPDFSVAEFEIQRKDFKELCQVIKEVNYELGTVNASENTIDWLNEILQHPDLYEKIADKKPHITEIVEMKKLKEQTDETRNQAFKDLNDDEQKAIKRLNRLTIKHAHPQETPESPIPICKPWYCAKLKLKDKQDVKEENLKLGQTTEEYLEEEFIKDELVKDIYCSKKCYLAKLYEFKIKHKEHIKYFPYLFDHPFPNSFYAKFFYNSFINESINDFVSVEAQVVMQADEIAQRQQDLEDAVSTKLISFDMAKDEVKKLVTKVDSDQFQDLLDKIKEIRNQKELGEIIVDFYKRLLKDATLKNFVEFSDKREKTKINIYCAMNILSSFERTNKEKKKWILRELDQLAEDKGGRAGITNLNDYFDINEDVSYFYFIVYDFLDNSVRFAEDENCQEILPQFVTLLKARDGYMGIEDLEEEPKAKGYIRELESIRTFLKDKFSDAFKDFALVDERPDYWKNLSQLNLFAFYLFHNIYQQCLGGKESISIVNDLRQIDMKEILKEDYDKQDVFIKWKSTLKTDANRVLAQLVYFISDNDKDKETKKKGLKDFHNQQKNYILKSEIVEKNDGKANYILKRLFGAFVTNSHQLPDNGLINILLSLGDDEVLTLFQKNETEIFEKILRKLKKTVVDTDFDAIKSKILGRDFETINDEDLKVIKKGTSNEIKALIDSRKDLFDFLKYFKEKIKIRLNKLLQSEDAHEVVVLEEALLRFRGILDNPILNAMPYWKSLLTRGICDYIVGLTDQQAISQYEKLYASVMELV